MPESPVDAGTEEALQLLPGSLEILAGADGPAAIRFFRSAALEVPEITLGRSHGAPYRHIHLWAPSVSRLHARLRFEGGRWKITNLSHTNPIRVNGLVFDAPDAVCTLSDGDHIQLGEVVLLYRENRP
jgi:pSer/pThr/pTyr-binding forkhead associated (FHA) protein